MYSVYCYILGESNCLRGTHSYQTFVWLIENGVKGVIFKKKKRDSGKGNFEQLFTLTFPSILYSQMFIIFQKTD